MARPLRIEYADAHYHVMSRGNERREIVRDDADREKRLDCLRRPVETHDWRLHAFVLMNNHEHLFVQTPRANLSAGMQFLNGSYTSEQLWPILRVAASRTAARTWPPRLAIRVPAASPRQSNASRPPTRNAAES